MEQHFIITGIDRVIYVGKLEYPQKKSSFGTHLRSNELIFHISGYSNLTYNNHHLFLQPDLIRFLPKGPTANYDVDRIEHGDCIDICFQADRPISDDIFLMDVAGNAKIAALFKKIFSVWVGRNEGYYFECISLLYKIFAELQKQNYLPDKKYAQIRPAVEYIENHFREEDLSVEKLSDLCGISYSYFKQIFVEKYGVTPKKYLIQLKINYACDLLQSGQYNVTQTAEMAGFSNIYFFSRQFKEHIGIPPLEFIRKYKSSK